MVVKSSLCYNMGMDHLSKEKRSWNMGRIKSKDTKPEILVRSALHRIGFRFRLHYKDLPGKPDIYLPKYKTVIFVQGCFWHQHQGCSRSSIPKSNRTYWIDKLRKNVERDQKNKLLLEKLGYSVYYIWECETKNIKQVVHDFIAFINNNLEF